jgi:molecular chaperone GrpE
MEDEGAAAEAAEIGALRAENASLHDRLLRALAEAENTRARAEGAAADARKFAVAGFARELLVVADNLRRTLDAAEQQTRSADNAALVEGVRATLSILMQTLERFGVRRIEALGRRFDPYLHEAVMQIADPSQPSGTVVRVLEDGYTIHDRLLRPARVVVSKQYGPGEHLGSEWSHYAS